MASDDEDELCRFGTPLDPIEEGTYKNSKQQLKLVVEIHIDQSKRQFTGVTTTSEYSMSLLVP